MEVYNDKLIDLLAELRNEGSPQASSTLSFAEVGIRVHAYVGVYTCIVLYCSLVQELYQ